VLIDLIDGNNWENGRLFVLQVKIKISGSFFVFNIYTSCQNSTDKIKIFLLAIDAFFYSRINMVHGLHACSSSVL